MLTYSESKSLKAFQSNLKSPWLMTNNSVTFDKGKNGMMILTGNIMTYSNGNNHTFLLNGKTMLKYLGNYQDIQTTLEVTVRYIYIIFHSGL